MLGSLFLSLVATQTIYLSNEIWKSVPATNKVLEKVYVAGRELKLAFVVPDMEIEFYAAYQAVNRVRPILPPGVTCFIMGWLKRLDLKYSPITDLTYLSGLIELEWLNLNNTQVTDLSPLYELVNLRELHLSNTPLAAQEIDNLKSKIGPGLKVYL